MFGFTGEETDQNGLINLRARYYNPVVGQFFSRDPLEGNASKPMSLNRYSYVSGNVPNRTDPSGQRPFPLVMQGSAINLTHQLNEGLCSGQLGNNANSLQCVYDCLFQKIPEATWVSNAI